MSLGWLILAVAVLGGWWLYQKQNYGSMEIVWMLAMVTFYSLSHAPLFFWYIVPIYPIFIMFASAAIPFQWDRIAAWTSRKTVVRLVMATLMASGLLFMTYSQVVYYKDYGRYLNQVHKEIGLYLKEKADADDVVSAKYIGYTGYFSKLKVQDRDGMVNPAAANYNRRGDYLGLVL